MISAQMCKYDIKENKLNINFFIIAPFPPKLLFYYFKKLSASFKTLSTTLSKLAPDKFLSVIYKTEIW